MLLSTQVRARITIEITEGTEGTSPIAVVPFAWQGAGQAPLDMALVIESNLKRSGRFSALDRRQMLSKPASSIEDNRPDSGRRRYGRA